MSLFEYVATAYSLVLSFSAIRLVSGLPHALDPSRRYWVHVSLALIQLLFIATVFWALWSYRDVEWTFPRFLLVLANPVLVYFNACAMIPENSASVDSWRTYYFLARKRYFSGISLWALVSWATATSLLSMPLTHPARVFQASILIAGLAGARSDSPRLHATIASILILMVILVGFAVVARPGALAN